QPFAPVVRPPGLPPACSSRSRLRPAIQPEAATLHRSPVWRNGRAVAVELDGGAVGRDGRAKFETHHSESTPAVLQQDLSQKEFAELWNDEAVSLACDAGACGVHLLEVHDRAKNGSVSFRIRPCLIGFEWVSHHLPK